MKCSTKNCDQELNKKDVAYLKCKPVCLDCWYKYRSSSKPAPEYYWNKKHVQIVRGGVRR